MISLRESGSLIPPTVHFGYWDLFTHTLGGKTARFLMGMYQNTLCKQLTYRVSTFKLSPFIILLKLLQEISVTVQTGYLSFIFPVPDDLDSESSCSSVSIFL